MSSQKRILILGSSGFLGRHLYAKLGPDHAVATYHSTPLEGGVYFDAASMRLRDTILTGRHDLKIAFVLHGITRIDACARDPERSWQVNVESTMRAIDDLLAAGIKPIYASSCAVFDGSRGNWTEADLPTPTLTYGKQKAAVERYLGSLASPWIIARLSKVVGSEADALLGEWIRQIERDETIYCASDLVFSPAHVDDVVSALLRLGESELSGIFNVCGPQSMSRLAMLRILVNEIERYRKVNAAIVPCSIRDFPFLEPRPLDESMVPDKLYRALGLSFKDMRTVCSELARVRYGVVDQRQGVHQS